MSPAAVQHLGKDKENIQPSLSLLAGKEHPLFTDPSVSKRQENPSILHAQTYLFSPLTTLLASSQSQSPITPHDLLEAYHTLSCRLKALLPLIIIPGSGDVRIEALERLRSNASQLVQVLKRDIERALVNPLPFSSPSYTTTSSSYPYLSFSNQTASLSSGARYRSTTHIQLLNLTPADLQRASDEVGICHAALGLVGVLFRFECLFRLFEGVCSVSLLVPFLSSDFIISSSYIISYLHRTQHQTFEHSSTPPSPSSPLPNLPIIKTNTSQHHQAPKLALSSYGYSKLSDYQRKSWMILKG
jgi:hypothetical protein